MTGIDSSPRKARLVGVVIVNFNSADYLRRCLRALAEQTCLANSIVIVNNGDLPGALDFVAKDYPAIQVFDQPNIGFAAANNLAIDYLEGHEWIALLNPDAFPEPEWLDQLLIAVHTYPEISVFSSLLLKADNKQILDGDGDTYHFSGLAWRHNHGRHIAHAGEVREVFSACAAAALYRRDALINVQGFDASYFCYFEDIDLGFRLRLQGYRCLHIPAAKVQHVGSATSGGNQRSDFALYYGHRNLVWTFIKNMPGNWFWLLLPIHVLLNVVEIIWYACKGRSKIMCKAKLDAVKGIPAMWEERKIIQAQRTASSSSLLKLMSFWPLTLDR